MTDSTNTERRPSDADEEQPALLDVFRVAATPVDTELPAPLAHLQEAVIEHARVALAYRIPDVYWLTKPDFPAGWQHPHLVVHLLFPWLLESVASGVVDTKARKHGVLALALLYALAEAMDGQRGVWVQSRLRDGAVIEQKTRRPKDLKGWEILRLPTKEAGKRPRFHYVRLVDLDAVDGGSGNEMSLREQLDDLDSREDVPIDVRTFLRDMLTGTLGRDIEAVQARAHEVLPQPSSAPVDPRAAEPDLLWVDERAKGVIAKRHVHAGDEILWFMKGGDRAGQSAKGYVNYTGPQGRCLLHALLEIPITKDDWAHVHQVNNALRYAGLDVRIEGSRDEPTVRGSLRVDPALEKLVRSMPQP